MAKRRDRHQRQRPHRHRVRASGPAAGDPRIAAMLQQIGDGGLAWEDVAGEILPIFERARPTTFGLPSPALAVVPPGVTIGFGVDLGIAFMRVAAVHLEGWPVDLARVTRAALGNLRRRAIDAEDYDLVREPVCGVPTIAFQSRDGWASTTVLVPDAIEQFFGPRPALLIAPSRDLLIGLPEDVDIAFATWLSEEFEASDPNALRLEAFEWGDGQVRCRPLARKAVAV